MSSRRAFIQTILSVGAALFAAADSAIAGKIKGEVMSEAKFDTAIEPGFDPAAFLLVPAKRFEDLKVGDIFRAPSRTLTDAHAASFQTVSADNHPVHYDAVWAARHGHSAPVVHGLQVIAFTAPGATLFPHYIGEVFIAFTEVSCKFLKEVHSGDTLYSCLEIIDLSRQGPNGVVTTKVTIFNQRKELVLLGEHKYLLKAG
jgi:acyl dehydratase